MSQKKGRKKFSENKYETKYANEIYGLRVLNCTNRDLAKYFCVSENTIRTWIHRYPDFKEGFEKGSASSVNNLIGQSYIKMATGFNYQEDFAAIHNGKIVTKKITKHHAPDSRILQKITQNRTDFDFEAKMKKLEFQHKQKMDNLKHILDRDKLEFEKEKLKIEESQETDRQTIIDQFLQATKTDEKELEELFEDENLPEK